MKSEQLSSTDKVWYWILIECQMLDFVCTLVGVKFLGRGMDIEGNPIIKYLMQTLGVEIGLGVAKVLALLFIFILYKKRVGGVIIVGVSIFYIFVVLAWVYAFIIL